MAAPDEKPRRYQALIGDRVIDLELGSRSVVLDGRERPYSAERLAGGTISLIIEGRSLEAIVRPSGKDGFVVQLGGHEFEVRVKDERDLLLDRFGMAAIAREGVREIRAPMPGLVLSVAVEEGAGVQPGSSLLVLEAMKMENEIRCDGSGTVKTIHVAPGDAVSKNDLLIEIED